MESKIAGLIQIQAPKVPLVLQHMDLESPQTISVWYCIIFLGSSEVFIACESYLHA